ncbi:ClbS/DfsB family four-helix bundle protein [Demequina capsici]|uniref:ClbS/DfsB family four-helix bundle protein n=1 Tax=Demequina capsici TaxID=3075620 RepID=A0AA96FEV1_9MICO|nr:ClbS/DfsB family four-helix bundle protein [Demequina sp. PMTSA13]WNM28234.1 ClbS/DfsB family four-helix bundle protein [Demequina sp. PMTSA13]
MPRTRQQVIDAAADGLENLLARTDTHPDHELGAAYLDRRVADVLAHLHAWHLLFLGWVEAIHNGETPGFPADGYTWQDLTSLNDALYERHRSMPYMEIRAALLESHVDALEAFASLDDELISSTDSIEWLGNEAFADVAHESLGGHYDWAQGVLDAAHMPPA